MNDTITKCLGCGRYRSEDGSWVEMRTESKGVLASHTYCEECAVTEDAKADEFAQKMKGRVPA